MSVAASRFTMPGLRGMAGAAGGGGIPGSHSYISTASVTSLHMEVSGNHRNVSHRTQMEYIPKSTSSAFKIAESFLTACSTQCGMGGAVWSGKTAITAIKLCQSLAGEGKKF